MATQETIKQMRVSENGPLRDLEDTTARAGVSALQSALASLQSALDTLMGTDDITDEIDTYNEIKDFLDGFDVNDPTLSSQLALLNSQVNDLTTAIQNKANTSALNTAVANLQALINGKVEAVPGKGLSTNDYTNEDKAAVATIASKANSADVYTKSQTYDKDEVDAKVADAGKVKSVTINGTKKTPNETTGDVDLGTIVGEQGPKGDKGDTLLVDGEFNPITDIVNDTTTGGANKALSAEQGKKLDRKVRLLDDSDAALDFADAAGNVVLRITNGGHIRTKNFNSSDITGGGSSSNRIQTPQMISHGANSPLGAEYANTMAHILNAIARGYYIIEVDAYNCTDGVQVLSHDNTITLYKKNSTTGETEQVTITSKSSTELINGYTHTPPTVENGVITAYGEPIITLHQAIYNVCYIHKCMLYIDGKTGITAAVRKAASQYADSLGVADLIIHELLSGGYTDWGDLPCNAVIRCAVADIPSMAETYKTDNNMVFFNVLPNGMTDESIKAFADAAHDAGCYALVFTLIYVNQVKQWVENGFDYVITESGITNNKLYNSYE